MGHLQVSSVNSSSCFGFSGSKFLSSNNDLNLAFLLSLLPFGWVSDWVFSCDFVFFEDTFNIGI